MEDSIDPQKEVKKLQDLVKKLEQQNEVLRSKGGILDSKKHSSESDSHSDARLENNLNSLGLNNDDDVLMKKNSSSGLDALEDIDYSDIVSNDEDSWLYSSPKAKSPQEPTERIVRWMRQDLDHPSPEVEASRRGLLARLDQVATMKHSSSSPAIGSSPNTSSPATLSHSQEDRETPMGGGEAGRVPLRRSGLTLPGSSRIVDTGTFTRPKRAVNGGPNGASGMRGEGDGLEARENPNAEDIENLAKQQEESLRQSITTSQHTPSSRKGLGLRSKQDMIDGDGSRLSPSRFDLEGSYLSRHRDSIGSEHSNHSTPPDSPHGNSHNSFSHSNGSDSLRPQRNLSRLQYRSHNSSEDSLERHSNTSDEPTVSNIAPEAMRTSTSRLQGLQPQYGSPRQPRPSPGLPQPRGISPQPRGMSPHRTSGLPMSGLPAPTKRQIPRPGSATRTSLPTFRRSAIPSPKPVATQEAEDWRDGCF